MMYCCCGEIAVVASFSVVKLLIACNISDEGVATQQIHNGRYFGASHVSYAPLFHRCIKKVCD